MNTSNEYIFPQGERGSADYFSGTTWVTLLIQKGGDISYAVNNVVFEPGARTYWHTHPAGQILLVTDGNGFYQEKGRPAQLLTKGSVINIPANVEHWHGAAKDHRLVHIAITNFKDDVNVVWLEPVSPEDYSNVNQ